ncbi:uncharacterized protein LOC134456162 [Engraulis encrasicolus]|uniref:uncharacterized protein LOC134456162 n=1 Tax=Engraulis encrasicolus TaxID=184585 RepID=UPI002FD41DE4
MYKRALLRSKEAESPLRPLLDTSNKVSQSRDILGFYKSPEVDWARPLHCSLAGDPAVGIGVQRHFLNLAVEKLQQGFHVHSDMTNVTLLFEGEDDHLLPSTSESIIDIDLFIVAGRIIGHSFLHGGPPLYGLSEAVVQMVVQGTADMSSMTVRDVADFDLRGTIKMLDGEAELTGAEVDQINQLALSWDLPPLSSGNRQYLYQKLLKHAVLVRRSRQVKQIRKGLKETNVLPMLKERPDTAEVLFPRAASVLDCLTLSILYVK